MKHVENVMVVVFAVLMVITIIHVSHELSTLKENVYATLTK